MVAKFTSAGQHLGPGSGQIKTIKAVLDTIPMAIQNRSRYNKVPQGGSTVSINCSRKRKFDVLTSCNLPNPVSRKVAQASPRRLPKVKSCRCQKNVQKIQEIGENSPNFTPTKPRVWSPARIDFTPHCHRSTHCPLPISSRDKPPLYRKRTVCCGLTRSISCHQWIDLDRCHQ